MSSTRRIAQRAALAASIIIGMGLMSSCSVVHYLVAQPSSNITRAKPVCMPIAHTHDHIPPPAKKLKRVQLQDPTAGNLAWSCAGELFAWSSGSFRPFPVGSPWCRQALNATGHMVEYRIKPVNGTCGHGRLIFLDRTYADGRSYWFDPALNYWLSIDNQYLSSLEGDTQCNGWQPINLDSVRGGAFFRADNQRCLAAHNHRIGLGIPGSLSLLRHRINRWEMPPGLAWYDITQAPVCQAQFHTYECATVP